ncbi:MAG: prenyltransferase [Halobaculum sp.]
MSSPAVGESRVRRQVLLVRALWRMVRPDQLGLILLVYCVGAAAALSLGSGTSVATDSDTILGGLIALVPTTASVHYANEYADYETDALSEGTQFSGGSGALQEYGLPRSLARTATVVSGVAVLPAAWVAVESGVRPGALAILGVILVVGWEYSLPPLALAWRGLGVATNAFVGAFLLPVYGYAVLAEPTTEILLLVTPFTLLTASSLLTTQWPDRHADAQAGKRTLSTRVDPAVLRRLFTSNALSYPILVGAIHLTVGFPTPVLLAHVAVLPLVAWSMRTCTRQRSPFPAVAAMVTLAVGSLIAWSWTLFA